MKYGIISIQSGHRKVAKYSDGIIEFNLTTEPFFQMTVFNSVEEAISILEEQRELENYTGDYQIIPFDKLFP